MSVQTQINRINGAVSDQTDLISQLKGAINENVSKTSSEVSEQASLIAEIKTALEGKAGGGTVLPTLTNAGTASDLVQGKQLIDASGNVVTGSLTDHAGSYFKDCEGFDADGGVISPYFTVDDDIVLRSGTIIYVDVYKSEYGNAKPEDVRAGVTFTSENGIAIEGTAQMGGGYAIKSGTTTSRTINTGLSDVEQFFLYKETVTATGLIHLHYTKSATSRMYASAWSTQNYGSKTITNGTGGVTVSGGTVTISATQAAQGALTGNVTYKWFAIGTE